MTEQVMKWRPIETAPTGVIVLICGVARNGYYVTDAKLEGGIWWQFDPLEDGYGVESDGHSHWMPLPAPPLDHQSDGEASAVVSEADGPQAR